MTPEKFVKSIYLGDRGCKGIVIDSWNKRVAIQVDLISRIKPETVIWDFYSDGDIEDGWLVFSEVDSIAFKPSGPLPNDFINNFGVTPMNPVGNLLPYLFELSIGSADDSGKTTEVLVRIQAKRVHIEDPRRPGVEIRD